MQPLDVMPLIYIAGPYTPPPRLQGWRSSDTAREAAITAHVEHAVHWGREVILRGGFPVIPHAIGALVTRGIRESYGMAGRAALTDEATWLAGDMLLLRACHGALFIPGWDSSRGAKAEQEEADRLEMPQVKLSASDAADVVRFEHPGTPIGPQRFDTFDEALSLLVTGASFRRQDAERPRPAAAIPADVEALSLELRRIRAADAPATDDVAFHDAGWHFSLGRQQWVHRSGVAVPRASGVVTLAAMRVAAPGSV